MIKDLQADTLTYAKSFPLWNSPFYSRFWIQETHRLDRINQLDLNCNIDGNQILSLLLNWASQKQFLDNSHVSINYNLEFCESDLKLQIKGLILSIVSFYIRRLKQNSSLDIDFEKIKNETSITFTFENESHLLPLKSTHIASIISFSGTIINQKKSISVFLIN